LIHQEAVRVPAFDLGRVRQWRKKITLRFTSFYGMIIDEPQMQRLVGTMCSVLKLKTDEQEIALRRSLLEFVGQEMTGRVGDQIATKLAGGLSLIRDGEPVTGILKEEGWYPVMVTDMRFARVLNGKTRLNMTVMVTAGSMSGREILTMVSYKLVMWMMANELAWSMRDMRPLHSELVGMWFLGYIKQGKDGKLAIGEIKCLDQHKRYNKKLRKQRAGPCIRHYNQRCHTCPIGYSECMLGTHRYTWIVKKCQMCQRPHAAFDPEQKNAKACISCQTRDVRAHWARERMG
jgi:hypothetical protein